MATETLRPNAAGDETNMHTPLLDNLLADLKGRGFTLLDEFFDASEELNMQELGYQDRQHFTAKATDTDRQALEEMWH